MNNNKITIPVAQMIPMIKTAIENGKTVEMTVTGNSMMPLLKDRRSSVKLIRADRPQPGDIVFFQKEPNHFVLHRIVNVHDGVYDIVGDNQYVQDKNVPKDAIIAKVAAYNRSGRRWKSSDAFYRAILPAVKVIRRFGSRVKRKLCSIFMQK